MSSWLKKKKKKEKWCQGLRPEMSLGEVCKGYKCSAITSSEDLMRNLVHS